MHYPTFEVAKQKWLNRVKRMDVNNVLIMFTNWNGDIELAKRFDLLPFKHKVLFTSVDLPDIKCAFRIKKWDITKPLHRRYSFLGKRYIDQFDYVAFINETSSTHK